MSNDAIQVTTLPSGLTIVTETMPRVETVSFGAYVASGTRHEEAAVNGAPKKSTASMIVCQSHAKSLATSDTERP